MRFSIKLCLTDEKWRLGVKKPACSVRTQLCRITRAQRKPRSARISADVATAMGVRVGRVRGGQSEVSAKYMHPSQANGLYCFVEGGCRFGGWQQRRNFTWDQSWGSGMEGRLELGIASEYLSCVRTLYDIQCTHSAKHSEMPKRHEAWMSWSAGSAERVQRTAWWAHVASPE